MQDTGLGLLGVDWEERIDFARMRTERVEKAKQALKAAEVDAVFFFRLENARYLTSLRTHQWPVMAWGTASTILPRDHEPILVCQDYNHVQARMPWIRENTIEFPPGGLEFEYGAKCWADLAKKKLFDLGINPKRIGVDAYSPAMAKVFPQVFSEVELVDGEAIILQARAIKTPEEVKCLRQAYAITAAGMEAGRKFLRPGRKECEVLAECFRAMFYLGSEWTQCANIVCSGPYTVPYRRFTSDRIILPGDFVIIDIGSIFNGYYGDFTRTWICGKDVQPTKEQIQIHMECYNALRACEKAIKPGATTWEVSRASGERILGGRLGHGIGVGAMEPPYFGSEVLIPKERAVVLQPGMVFSVEPYAGKPGIGGVRLEDNFLVTENGCEVLSKFYFEERLLQ